MTGGAPPAQDPPPGSLGNDFTALFELVAGSPRTYLGAAGVFALAEGRSFYPYLP